MTIEHKVVPFALKATADDGGSFEGLGAVFHNIDGVGDIIVPGAFRAGLSSFLKDGYIGGLNHDWKQPIGHPVDARETTQGLFIKAVLDDTPDAQAVRNRMKVNPKSGRATIQKLSIGYNSTDDKLIRGDEVKAYWHQHGYTPSATDLKRAQRPVRLLNVIDLREVSPVTMPANDLASVSAVKGDLLGDTDGPMAHAALCCLTDSLGYFLHQCLGDESLDGPGRLAQMQAGVDEFAAALPAVAGLVVEDDASDGPDDGAYGGLPILGYMSGPEGIAAFKNHVQSVLSGGAVAAPSFSDRSRQVVAALGEFTALARKFADQRAKSGRVLSTANRKRISAAVDSMNACLSDLTALLDATAPEPPKAAEPDELRRKRFHFLAGLALLD